MTPDQHLQAAKEAVGKKYGYENWESLRFSHSMSYDKHDAYYKEACLLALTNQAEEYNKEIDNLSEIITSLNRRDP